MHCSGHIHDGHGPKIINWNDDQGGFRLKAIEARGDQLVKSYLEPRKLDIRAGKETLMVNASIMDGKYRHKNAPWLIDFDLPLSS